MKRKIASKLLEWKNSKSLRQPLILQGARQVGKTYLLKEFALNEYKNHIYINFEQDSVARGYFEVDLFPERIIDRLASYFNQQVIPEATLLIFDEIQACPQALSSLKYFSENAPQYHVIAAGSLLGVAINRSAYSFPVGKVSILTLHPMDFEEYLVAIGKQYLINEIKDCYAKNNVLSTVLHQQGLDFFEQYLRMGGMPAVVLEHINGSQFQKVSDVQNNILTSYIADMVKYATPSESVKIRTAFDSIPAQLAKENKKYQYKLLRKGASASHFGTALEWLDASGIVTRCWRIDHGYMPLASYKDLSAFKLYMADTGLLTRKAGILAENVSDNYRQSYFKGALMESMLAQSLIANSHDLFYWESNSQAEVDFVVNIDGNPIPIEVKSSENVRSRSLGVFKEKYQPPYAIRVSSRNFGLENGIKSVPHYAVFMI